MIDPTTAEIERSIADREHLRAEVTCLERSLADAYTEMGAVKAERDLLSVAASTVETTRAEVFRLRKISDEADTAFKKGYDQAVDEICDHFKKENEADVVLLIQKIWMKGRRS